MRPIARQILDLSESRVRFARTAEILAHWLKLSELGEPGSIPSFDPVDVPKLLPFIYLLERNGNRLRYRVSGEEVNRLFGSSHIGRHFDEVVPAEIYGDVAPFFFRVLDGFICIFKGHVLLPEREHMEFERILLPVNRNGQIQLLGTLCLSTTSELRQDVAPPPPPESGFHFHLLELATGELQYERKDLAPLADRYSSIRQFR